MAEGEFGRDFKGLFIKQQDFMNNFTNISKEIDRIKKNCNLTFTALHSDIDQIADSLLKTQDYLSDTKSKLHRDIRDNKSGVAKLTTGQKDNLVKIKSHHTELSKKISSLSSRLKNQKKDYSLRDEELEARTLDKVGLLRRETSAKLAKADNDIEK
mmetsp:Transcript_31812/g.31224  ORF Transcript_31812/g.31224 Transcript_31812/m.31224 type:complete len:156 (+) Transcript_31812:477-944(+)|eukprot:CAMPEP_0197012644 /NCGR_PEP_ID=MMETSP1380-20130617/63256_1 /TAXON_ID=5936 /ORGANISM="Euplotes crassus, Strain CT5" /LENGTH=155 /DNA_ID=CAMNT_0042436289 /DNA_START=493 /DNA_END=960 /DNA_ORIENTATION=+